MFKSRYIFLIIIILLVTSLFAKELSYKFEVGSKYKAISVVEEDIYVNGQLGGRSTILNKINVEIVATADNKGEMVGKYFITENVYSQNKNKNPIFSIQPENIYNSRFWQDKNGALSEDEDDIMPVVRNLPMFPDYDLQPGDTWNSQGYEVHDFSQLAGVVKPVVFPSSVNYKYIGEEKIEGVLYDKIEVTYKVNYTPGREFSIYRNFPIKIVGSSALVILWDNEVGRVARSFEKFDLLFVFPSGEHMEFIGQSDAKIIKVEEFDSKSVEQNLQNQLKDNKDIQVEKREDGIALVMSDIKFVSDTDILIKGEDKKIEKIAKILKNYPNNDIKVIGHTALSGTIKAQDELSVVRAAKVAQMLIDFGAKSNKEIMIEGKGSRVPIATNTTKEGMAKNRRVEVIILEE